MYFIGATTVTFDSSLLGKASKRAYRRAVVILGIAIDLIEAHFMYHVDFPFAVIKVAYLRRNVSHAVLLFGFTHLANILSYT